MFLEYVSVLRHFHVQDPSPCVCCLPDQGGIGWFQPDLGAPAQDEAR